MAKVEAVYDIAAAELRRVMPGHKFEVNEVQVDMPHAGCGGVRGKITSPDGWKTFEVEVFGVGFIDSHAATPKAVVYLVDRRMVDKPDLKPQRTKVQKTAMDHLLGHCHNTKVCQICQLADAEYKRGYAAAIKVVAEG
jgi:hypothetical protein